MTEPGPTDPASQPPAAAPLLDPVPEAKTNAERRAQNREAWRRLKWVGVGSASEPTASASASARECAPEMPDPATADGRSALARAAVAWMWEIIHEVKPGTNLDRATVARELLALAGYRRAAPSVKEEAIPFTSMLSRPSDGESKARTDVTPGGATPPAPK